MEAHKLYLGRVRKTNGDLSMLDSDYLLTNCTQISSLFNSCFSPIGIGLSDKIPQQNEQP